MSLTDRINAYLEGVIPASDDEAAGLDMAMRYSLLAGGKRIRPRLALEFVRALGGDIDECMPAACAIEMAHTYSLIHDDLPCMDNDDLRRGKPTNHVVYGECTATLAGDALQSLAFSQILSSPLSAERKAKCALILADAIGHEGMCLGQYLDMAGEGRKLTSDELDRINDGKTGALLSASCMIGTAAAGGTDRQLEAAGEFGRKLGLAFQIRDDILDVTSTAEELGKTIGSDAEENKNTYMVLLGRERCEVEIERLTEEALSALRGAFRETEALEAIALSLKNRTK